MMKLCRDECIKDIVDLFEDICMYFDFIKIDKYS